MDLGRIASRVALLFGQDESADWDSLLIIERNDREGRGPQAYIGYEHGFSYDIAQESADSLVKQGFAEWDDNNQSVTVTDDGKRIFEKKVGYVWGDPSFTPVS